MHTGLNSLTNTTRCKLLQASPPSVHFAGLVITPVHAFAYSQARFPEFVAVRLTTAAERRDTLPHITHPSNAHNNPTTSEPQHDELSTQLASGSGHISWTEKDAASPAAHTSGQASHSEDVCSQTHGSAQALDSRGTSVDSVASSGGSLEAWGYNHLSLTLRCLQRFGQQLADPTLEVSGHTHTQTHTQQSCTGARYPHMHHVQ